MSDADNKTSATGLRASRRAVIKGVIASGVAVSAAGYLVYERYGAGGRTAGTVERLVTLNVNGKTPKVFFTYPGVVLANISSSVITAEGNVGHRALECHGRRKG